MFKFKRVDQEQELEEGEISDDNLQVPPSTKPINSVQKKAGKPVTPIDQSQQSEQEYVIEKIQIRPPSPYADRKKERKELKAEQKNYRYDKKMRQSRSPQNSSYQAASVIPPIQPIPSVNPYYNYPQTNMYSFNQSNQDQRQIRYIPINQQQSVNMPYSQNPYPQRLPIQNQWHQSIPISPNKMHNMNINNQMPQYSHISSRQSQGHGQYQIQMQGQNIYNNINNTNNNSSNNYNNQNHTHTHTNYGHNNNNYINNMNVSMNKFQNNNNNNINTQNQSYYQQQLYSNNNNSNIQQQYEYNKNYQQQQRRKLQQQNKLKQRQKKVQQIKKNIKDKILQNSLNIVNSGNNSNTNTNTNVNTINNINISQKQLIGEILSIIKSMIQQKQQKQQNIEQLHIKIQQYKNRNKIYQILSSLQMNKFIDKLKNKDIESKLIQENKRKQVAELFKKMARKDPRVRVT